MQRNVPTEIADGFLAWIMRRPDATQADRPRLAAAMPAGPEGLMLLTAIGRRSLADAAAVALTDRR